MRRRLALSPAALVVLCCGCGAVAVPRAVWIDIGDRDQLRPGATELAHELRADGADITFHVWPGAHTGTYWDAHFAQYLSFEADACE
ncbi:MAG TPA: hypothetical protein VKB73_16815 [Gaiellaceae bacterium]|nr:hypothetical protein [Gaiellaceae bacterium]